MASTRKFLGQNIVIGEAVCDTIARGQQIYQSTPSYFDAIKYMQENGGITHEDKIYRFYDESYSEDPLFAFRRTFIDSTHFIVEYRFRRGEPTNPWWGDDSTGWWTCPRNAEYEEGVPYTYPGVVWDDIKADDHWRTGIWFFKADIYSDYQGGVYRWEYPYGAALGHEPIIDSIIQGRLTDTLIAGAYQEIESGEYAGSYEPAPGSVYYNVYRNGTFISPAIDGAYIMLALMNLSQEVDSFEDDTAEAGGGYGGGYGFYSDHIGVPGLPTISILDTGMASMFNPTPAQSRLFANFLWSDDFFDNIIKLLGDPLENVISFASVPLDVSSLHGAVSEVKVGNVGTGVNMPLLTSQYKQVSLGSVPIPHNWFTALDYEPGSQIEIFLPFCGMFNLSASEVRGGTVTVDYNIDLLSGDFCAFVTITNNEHNNLNSVLYHKTGNLLTNFPLTEANYAQFYKSVIAGAAGAVSGAVTGNPLIAAGSIVDAAMSIGSVQLERTGSFSGATSGMSCRKAYLVLTQPKQHLPADYSKYIGYPSFLKRKLSAISGYTKVESVIDNTVSAPDDEKVEIERLLKEGVIL